MCQRDKSGQQTDDCRENAEVGTHRTPPLDIRNQAITRMAGRVIDLISSFLVSKDGTPKGMFMAGAKTDSPPPASARTLSSQTGETTRRPFGGSALQSFHFDWKRAIESLPRHGPTCCPGHLYQHVPRQVARTRRAMTMRVGRGMIQSP